MEINEREEPWIKRVEELITMLEGTTIGELELTEAGTEIIIRRRPDMMMVSMPAQQMGVAQSGMAGFYLISDGSPNPYRYRVRPPSLINLTILEDMCLGQTVADVVVILGSVDIVMGEVDR